MYEDLVAEFQDILSTLTDKKEPETAEELAQQLAEVSKAMQVCERVLLYAATSAQYHDDVIVHLFEYKQLIRLQQHLTHLKTALPVATPVALVKKKWWQA